MSEFTFNQYIKIASEFKLGELTTESYHPKTKNLSYDSKNNLTKAIASLKEVDIDALNILKTKAEEIFKLQKKCKEVTSAGGKIFLCGCGATGRLSLAIETFARMEGKDNVIGFMAGGDYALIKSVESFEDRMSYGSRQLTDLGFSKNDLLLAITEGGETSFVIGAAMEASKISIHSPYFLYCNPDQELIHLERCRNILEDNHIVKMNLNIGAMALSGSTRMQATTVQMLAAGAAILFDEDKPEAFIKRFYTLTNQLIALDYSFIHDFIVKESQIYQDKGFVTYMSDEKLAISILTDTTERSPTFSLMPFETNNNEKHSLCYLTIDKVNDSKEAWQILLKRAPRALEWGNLEGIVDLNSIYSYDISSESIKRRSQLHNHKIFHIKLDDDQLIFKLGELSKELNLDSNCILSYQLTLKVLLNAMSTLIMGRLGRYESNIMTWVKPSNYKLIDRAIRYVDHLLKQQGINKSYQEIAKVILELAPRLNKDDSVVLKATEKFKG